MTRRTTIAWGRALALSLAAAFLLSGCLHDGFSGEGPCNGDGRAPGTYPELEAVAPTTFDDKAPTTLDSGRNCSDEALGSLVIHGVHEIRFGGATWDLGFGRALTIATLGLPEGSLPVGWVEEFYELGARTAKRTEHVDVTRPDLAPLGVVFRLDTLNDLSFQTVIVWPAGERVRVVLVASQVGPNLPRELHEQLVSDAVAAAAAVLSSGR